MLKLSALDHSQICEGRTAGDTLLETTRLAQETDKFGYTRFWVSEHHSSTALAHSSPEVLIAHIAAMTKRIRVGSGGIMATHYSAYKIAENFRLLEALHPGRIDLGIGRAPGGTPLSSRALQEGKYNTGDQTPQQVSDLTHYFHDNLPADHRFAGLQVSPVIPTVPEIWMLGSSQGSDRIAAQHGTAFAYAQFFGVPQSDQSIASYKQNFKPSILNKKPHALAAVLVICAETEEEANRLAMSSNLFYLKLEQGRLLDTFPSVQTAEDYRYTPNDLENIAAKSHRRVIGTPAQVKAKLLAMSEQYGIDEIMVVSPIHNFADRVRSYRLLGEVFELDKQH
ncbi:LLM class flavin-dependent oxidoreductase [Paenibacillus psychroresistens]|uniref:LLM class flavin-dependent oxidoreductase n=1 Tax=Paenibacillus psychroresistens TaxID=1778678 RepID=A0A6B8RU05_9BACL|nr:LLM class flavin-dependent oxidoreductase [Paenibacillus psychroresistens]QGQ98933.1 LLM class flavin-dependent oxidoreductase [Paenibacillus psychroresistens]